MSPRAVDSTAASPARCTEDGKFAQTTFEGHAVSASDRLMSVSGDGVNAST